MFTVINSCPFPVWPGTLPLADGGFLLPPPTRLVRPILGPNRLLLRPIHRNRPLLHRRLRRRPTLLRRRCPPRLPLRVQWRRRQGLLRRQHRRRLQRRRPRRAGRLRSGYCKYSGCNADLNQYCPAELQVVGEEPGAGVVTCRSACAAFDFPEYCCTGDHSSRRRAGRRRTRSCSRAHVPQLVVTSYDDATSTCTSAGTDYVVTFCRTGP